MMSRVGDYKVRNSIGAFLRSASGGIETAGEASGRGKTHCVTEAGKTAGDGLF